MACSTLNSRYNPSRITLRCSIAAVFISHAFSSSPEANRDLVARIARRLALAGHLPLAPQLLFPHFIDETTERHIAMKLSLELLALANEIRLYGPISPGMAVELEEAFSLGIPIGSERRRYEM
jgi:hypothetical protein